MKALAAALMLLLTANGCPADPPAKPSKQKCVEGDSCWDCKTMGNRKCGPADPKKLVILP